MAISTEPWSRRRFLRTGTLLLGGLGLAPNLLAACDGDSGGGATGLNIDTWPIYIDDDPETGTIARFGKATGIEVAWNEVINDTNEYFAKIQPQLSRGKTVGADIMMPTFWLVPRLIELGWLQKVPSFANRANLVPWLETPSWDPTGEYSIPWQAGVTGIAYNRKAVGGEVTSMAQLLAPALKGRVGVLTEMRDTVGLFMLADGKDPAMATVASAQGAFAMLEKAKYDGQIRRFTGQDYLDDLVAGNFAACIAWSGDAAQLAREDPNIGFAIPTEGGMQWADCMVIPKGSTKLDNTATFMNFVYDPANAARISAAVQYVSPVRGVADELRKLGADEAALADSAVLFPDAATTARLHTFASLDEAQEAVFEETFSRIAGS